MEHPPEEQLGLLSREDLYEIQGADQLHDLYRWLGRVAQLALDYRQQVGDVLRADGELPKTKRKPQKVL